MTAASWGWRTRRKWWRRCCMEQGMLSERCPTTATACLPRPRPPVSRACSCSCCCLRDALARYRQDNQHPHSDTHYTNRRVHGVPFPNVAKERFAQGSHRSRRHFRLPAPTAPATATAATIADACLHDPVLDASSLLIALPYHGHHQRGKKTKRPPLFPD